MNPPAYKGQMIGVRVRLGWRGQPVVQIKRQLVRSRFIHAQSVVMEPCGETSWLDAGKADAIELAQYLEGIGSKD